MSDHGYDAEPPPSLLPSTEQQAYFAEHLGQGPGIDVFASIKEGSGTGWPPGSLYIRGLVRPGFSGNISVTPYRTVSYLPGQSLPGTVTLTGCGLFTMVYQNPNHQPRTQPIDHQYPDFAPLDVRPNGNAQTVLLNNGGRLLVSKEITRAGGGTSSHYAEPPQQPGIVSIERIVGYDPDEVHSLFVHLAIGMALKGQDVTVFADQPFRKIEGLPPPSGTSAAR